MIVSVPFFCVWARDLLSVPLVMTVSVGTYMHLTIPVYMAVPGTFLSAHFRVTDSVPAVFTCTRARFFRYSCVFASCLRLVLVSDGSRCVRICDAHPHTHPNPKPVNNPSLRAET